VIAGIDSKGDGAFSKSEERAYARRVLGDLSIMVNGSAVRPVLRSWYFPEPAQMREGLGEIHIDYSVACTADLLPDSANRSLTITNHHLNRTSVYLMNVLAPREPGIRIVEQKRNEEQ
jgi:hypothetical protein